jgi:hypothetical protein
MHCILTVAALVFELDLQPESVEERVLAFVTSCLEAQRTENIGKHLLWQGLLPVVPALLLQHTPCDCVL